MYLNEALTKLKNLKSKASRVEGYIEASAVFYEDQEPEHNYEQEVLNREHLNREILELKTRVQLTNATTNVQYRGVQMTLSQLILENAALRAEMAFVTKQMAHSAFTESYHGRKKDDIKKIVAPGCNKQALKIRLDLLEQEKESIEQVMAHANADNELV